jgi:hypothetical protein
MSDYLANGLPASTSSSNTSIFCNCSPSSVLNRIVNDPATNVTRSFADPSRLIDGSRPWLISCLMFHPRPEIGQNWSSHHVAGGFIHFCLTPHAFRLERISNSFKNSFVNSFKLLIRAAASYSGGFSTVLCKPFIIRTVLNPKGLIPTKSLCGLSPI